MIGARRDNAFRAHARRLTGADRPRCPLRGLVNYSAARVRKRERKEGRKRERRKGKREKKERKEYELTKVSSSNGMGREGIRIWRSFLYRHRAAPVFGGAEVLVLYDACFIARKPTDIRIMCSHPRRRSSPPSKAIRNR